MSSEVPTLAAEAVLVTSGELPVEKVEVQGYDFNKGVDYHELLSTFKTSGFQATNFGLAVDEINKMVSTTTRIFLFVFAIELFYFPLTLWPPHIVGIIFFLSVSM